ncbi:MAG: DNA methyltransferase [bacterium]
MKEDKKYVELIWAGKYNEFQKGEKFPIEKPDLPFQTVETINKPRLKDLEDGIFDPDKFYPENKYPSNYPKDWKNLLIWGDNKLVMSSLIKQGWAGKINLIYIDPPFYTGADFTVRTKIGGEEIEKEPSIIEERAYKDTWSGGIASYLKYMYDRLVLMRELLAETGSIYVHLDWHVGHYVKVMMDEIFGYENFQNEAVWHYRTENIAEKIFARRHGVLLLYSKSPDYIFNPIEVKDYYKDIYGPEFKPGFKGKKQAKDKYGDYRIVYADDVWDISSVFTLSYEHLTYDTQNPEALLKRIILVSPWLYNKRVSGSAICVLLDPNPYLSAWSSDIRRMLYEIPKTDIGKSRSA